MSVSDVRAGTSTPTKATNGESRRLPADFADALLAMIKQGLSAVSRGLAPHKTSQRSRLDFWTVHEEMYR